MMKKQLLTGALALSMMMGGTTMAMANTGESVDMTQVMTPVATVSMTPLVEAQAFEGAAGVVDASKLTKAIKVDLKEMKPYTVKTIALDLVNLKASLIKQVAEGILSQDEADKMLKDKEMVLKDVKEGAIQMYKINFDDVDDADVVKAIALTPTNTITAIDFTTEAKNK